MSEFLEKNKDKIAESIKTLGGFMNLDCQVEIKEESDSIDSRQADLEKKILTIAVYTPDNARFLIGRNGENLKALEHIMRAMLLKNNKEIAGISVDVNDYKKSRASYVIDLAKETATRVRNTQKAEALCPMTAYERRVVHTELASCPDLSTESIGDEPQRRVVIKPLNL